MHGPAVALRDSWYGHLDYKEGLITAAKNDAENQIDRFISELATYKVDDEIKNVRNKAIAHITTGTLSEPLIRDVTRLSDDALQLVQLAHDIFDGGDSGLGRREIFRQSAPALVRPGLGE